MVQCSHLAEIGCILQQNPSFHKLRYSYGHIGSQSIHVITRAAVLIPVCCVLRAVHLAGLCLVQLTISMQVVTLRWLQFAVR